MPPALTRGRPARRGDPRGAADPPGAQLRADQRRPVRRARGSVQPRPGDADGACGGPAGSAAAHHPGDQRPGRRRSRPTGLPPHRPATGGRVHHRCRAGRGARDPASSQRVAGRPDQGVRPGRARGTSARRRPAAEGGRVSPTFHSFRYANYRLWFTGAFVANIGTWMQRVAQDWLVLTVLTDDSGVAVGVTTALQFVPALFLSAWAGLLADRVDRRKLLMATQVGMGVLAGALGLLVMSGSAQLWHVYVFAGLLGCVTAIDGPARQTFVADMVPADRLANAVGLNSASFNAARMIGPGLAGPIIAWVGTGWELRFTAGPVCAPRAALARTPVGSPVVGWVAETFGARWSIGIGSIASLLVGGAAAVWAIRNWNLEVRYRLLNRPHLQVRYLDAEADELRIREQVAEQLRQQQAADGVTAA